MQEPDRFSHNQRGRSGSDEWHCNRFAGEIKAPALVTADACVSGILAGNSFLVFYPFSVLAGPKIGPQLCGRAQDSETCGG